MTAKILRIESRRQANVERRRKSRTPAVRHVTLESSQGERTDATLVDASSHGCAVRVAEDWTRPGAFISIRLGKSAPVQGIVRWVRDDVTGVEFLWPVPDANVEWREVLDARLS